MRCLGAITFGIDIDKKCTFYLNSGKIVFIHFVTRNVNIIFHISYYSSSRTCLTRFIMLICLESKT